MLGNNLSYARKKKGLTQRQLCNIIGISQSCLSQIENNTALPSIEIAKDIAIALEVSLDWLCFNSLNEYDSQSKDDTLIHLENCLRELLKNGKSICIHYINEDGGFKFDSNTAKHISKHIYDLNKKSSQ